MEDMKTIGIGILLMLWCLFTVMLALSVIGLVVLVESFNTGEKSTWMTLGSELVHKL